jgi:hypothetical protein
VRAVGGDGDAAARVEAAEALGLGEGLELFGGHRGAVWELRATLASTATATTSSADLRREVSASSAGKALQAAAAQK